MKKFTFEEFERMKDIDIQTVNLNILKDIRDVHIDENLSKEERVQQFLEQIENPYCYKYDKTIIKVSFSDTNATFEDRLKEYLSLLS